MTDSTPSNGMKLNHDRIQLQKGCFVQHGDLVYRIERLIDFETLVGIGLESGRAQLLKISELTAAPIERQSLPSVTDDLLNIPEADWQTALKRFEAIKPLLELQNYGRKTVEERAKALGTHPTTLYRWLQRYQAYGVVAALVPLRRGWKLSQTRLPSEQNTVLNNVIQEVYLNEQRHKISTVIEQINIVCRDKKITPPSESTVRARIAVLPERAVLRARGQKEQAENKFTPVPGRFPTGGAPLQRVLADHTPIDLINVDKKYRLPVARAWLTTIEDSYTRMILGIYLSYDAPSLTSVAMALTNAMLPKESWLEKLGIDAKWPVWGIPRTLHVDNGTDFRSTGLQQACAQYDINLEYRPVATPRFGGPIERLLGTIMKEVHKISGTTFSNVKQRQDYDSEEKAVMTFDELEWYIVTWISKVYHNRKHRALGMPPLAKWAVYFYGNADQEAHALPDRPVDPQSLRLDFLPKYERTIQPFGVSIDGRTYFDAVLRPWINASSPDSTSKAKKSFIFRRDPREISAIWFFDPQLKEYFKIPFSDVRFPKLSAWELQQVKESLKRMGITTPTDDQMLQGLKELREGVQRASQKTAGGKSARKKDEKRRLHEKNTAPDKPTPEPPALPAVAQAVQRVVHPLTLGRGVSPFSGGIE